VQDILGNINRRRGKLEGGEKRQQQCSQATVTQRKYKEKPLAKYKYSFLTKKRFYIYKNKREFFWKGRSAAYYVWRTNV